MWTGLQQNDNQNIQNNSSSPKNVDIYTFDDLMISCSQEIMVNGIESENIPSTIRDWISGKIVKALPKRLVQKLLSFLVDNRDMTETLGFREKVNGDVPEFTLLLYRTARAKARHEKNQAMNPNTEEIVEESSRVKTTTVLFDGNEKVNDPGVKFFSDEILVDQSQVIPVVQSSSSVNTRRKRKLIKKDFDEISEDEVDEKVDNGSDNSDIDVSSSEDEIDEETNSSKKKKKRKLEVDYMSERVQCHLCDKNYAQNSYLYRHYKDAHPEYWKTRPPMGAYDKITRFKIILFVFICVFSTCDYG